MAERYLGVAAPQPVLAIRVSSGAAPQPGLGVRRASAEEVAKAAKAAWVAKELAEAAEYQALLVRTFGSEWVAQLGAGNARPLAIRSHREFRAFPGTRMIDFDED